MNRKLIIGLSAVIAAIVLLLVILKVTDREGGSEFICNDTLGCVSIGPGEAVKIAVLQPLTGRLKDSGTVQIRGIELALSRRNNQLSGHPVELVFEDSQCSPEGGGVAALRVAADPQIVGIIGTNCSGAAAEASKVMSEAGLVMISGTNSAATLTSTEGKANSDWYPGYFRTMYNSLARGEAGALFAFKELGLRKAATINDGDNRSIELVEVFEKTFIDLGGEIVLSTAIDIGDTDMKPVLGRIAEKRAEIVFYPFFPPETVYFTRQIREIAGLENIVRMVCGSTMRTESFLGEVGDSGRGLYMVGKADLSGEAFYNLKEEYENTYTDLHDRTLYAFAFDAANILFEAIEKIVIESEDGTIHIQRQKLRDAMYDTSDFKGVTGLLSSDEFGDCGNPEFNILQLADPEKGYAGLMNNEVFRFSP